MEHFFKTLEIVGTESNLSNTIGNVFNIDLSGIHIINKPDSIITENESKNIHALSSGIKSVYITVMLRCNVAGHFLTCALSIIQRRQQEIECGDSLSPVSDVCMHWKSSHIRTYLFVTLFTEHFLKYILLGKVLLLLNCHRTHRISPLLLQTAAENNVAITLLPSLRTRTFQSTDKCFLWPYFKTKPQFIKSFDVARCASSILAGIKIFRECWFKWFESSGIYPFNCNKVPEYLFSISDTSENINSMEISP